MSDKPEIPGIDAAGSATSEDFIIIREGVNAEGNKWQRRDYGAAVGEHRFCYCYQNEDGSWYNTNPDGSKTYTNPIGTEFTDDASGAGWKVNDGIKNYFEKLSIDE